MKSITQKILALTAITLPLTVFAQTTPATPKGVAPSDQPTSQMQKDATTKSGEATKYGTQGTDTGTSGDPTNMPAASQSGSTGMHRGTKHETMKQKGTTEPGDAPTYPAPAKDGTPTK